MNNIFIKFYYLFILNLCIFAKKGHFITRRTGNIVAFFFPFIFIILLEFFLNLIHFDEQGPLWIPMENPEGYFQVNSFYGKKYFSVQSFIPVIPAEIIAKEKDSSIVRIVALGGSSTAGFPYFENGAFPRILKRMLELSHPEKTFEVINLGMTATNSYTMVDLIPEIKIIEPDAVIIYSGHNEFYGAYGSASTEMKGQLRKFVLWHFSLLKFRTYRALRMLILRTASFFKAEAAKNSNQTLMHRMVGEDSISYSDPIVSRTHQNYRKNLEDIIHSLKSDSIPVFIGSLVSNLKDQPPFVSVSSRKGYNRFIRNKFSEIEKMDSLNQQEAILYSLWNMDSTFAETAYRLGQLEFQREHFNQAGQYYSKARDLDGLRFRAASDMNRIIRSLGSQTLVHYVPVEEELSSIAEHHIIGNDLLLEHVHPNITGAISIARVFYERIESHFFGKNPQRFADSTLLAEIGYNDFDRILEKINMHYLLQDWPFKKREGKIVHFIPQNMVETIVFDAYTGKVSWTDARRKLAQYYEEDEQTDKAILEYKALRLALPYNIFPSLHLARLLLKQGRVNEAYSVLIRCNQFPMDKSSRYQFAKYISVAAIELKKYKTAKWALEQSVTLNPKDPRLWYNLGGTNLSLGDTVSARNALEQCLKLDPKHKGAQFYLKSLNK
ncbi:MAG: hypothetical protein Kow00108_12720 [Calditrichia bacterium]